MLLKEPCKKVLMSMRCELSVELLINRERKAVLNPLPKGIWPLLIGVLMHLAWAIKVVQVWALKGLAEKQGEVVPELGAREEVGQVLDQVERVVDQDQAVEAIVDLRLTLKSFNHIFGRMDRDS
jgi:hypothetical protein